MRRYPAAEQRRRPFPRHPYPAPRARKYDTSLEPGYTYTVRVRTQDCHGLRSAWGSGSFTLRRPAAAPQAVFGPRWREAAGVHTATAAGARAAVNFTGREVGIVALRGRGYGAAAVYLDGERDADAEPARTAPRAAAARVQDSGRVAGSAYAGRACSTIRRIQQ